MAYRPYTPTRPTFHFSLDRRIIVVATFFALGGLALIARFFQLQVLDHHTYEVLASDQHEVQSSLVPTRGTIYVKDRLDGKLYPIAIDRDVWQVYVVPREVKDASSTSATLAQILQMPAADVLAKLTSTSSFAVVQKDIPFDAVDQLQSQHLAGIGVSKTQSRLYPEPGFGGQIVGFVSSEDGIQRTGRYGLEGSFQNVLAGQFGSLIAEKDAAGRQLTIGNLQLKAAQDGSSIVLTLDRAIQYQACAAMQDTVKQFEAQSATVIIMDPQTGAILGMCSAPDFDPSSYGKTTDYSVFNNPSTFYQFEPGSIFKAITMSTGIDLNKVTPNTTYNDTGEEKIDDFTIHNSDKLAHGVQTMTEVLDKSLNTGTIFVERQIGHDAFLDYIKRFGFGDRTGVGLQPEAKGDISELAKTGKIFTATASFGQGISVTPLQMVTAYAALGNGGKLMKPYLVQDIIHPDGTQEKIEPQVVRQVIDPRTSRLISGMLVSVVENGHGKHAAVPGYYVAGKTGTAQIPNPNGKGYLTDTDATIGSFAGYAPADNPKFVMIVKVDRPKTVSFAESSAAPVFGQLAKFLLTYLQVPPERPIKDVPSITLVATSTSATTTGR